MYYEYPMPEAPRWPLVRQVVDFTAELAFTSEQEVRMTEACRHFDVDDVEEPDLHGPTFGPYFANPDDPFLLILTDGTQLLTGQRGLDIYFNLTGQRLPDALVPS